MNDLVTQLLGQVGPQGIGKLAESLGLDEQKAGGALAAAVPLLMGALAKNAQDPAEAQSIFSALEKDHDGSILDDAAGYIAQPNEADGRGILGHVLGGNEPVVEEQMSKGLGIDKQQIGKILLVAAPLVMAAIARKQRESQVETPGGLADLLGQEAEAAPVPAPALAGLGGIGGALGGMLDSDKDGSVVDDIAGWVGKFLGGK